MLIWQYCIQHDLLYLWFKVVRSLCIDPIYASLKWGYGMRKRCIGMYREKFSSDRSNIKYKHRIGLDYQKLKSGISLICWSYL